VMEYVAGVPITTYCDNHQLNTRERIQLFIHVCEGVQHAHQKAIIHRDLKPSNILVTEVDGHPAPKIIDFGVAKALTQKLTVDTMFTRVGALIGTPQYMSPEQASSQGEDIDTRTDVYSLGIVFYELLAGAPPLDPRRLGFEEFLRKLREEDPQKPSTNLRTQDEPTSTQCARNRHSEPRALIKQIRGDLDAIALKALEKDRSRRYGSPSEFAADIRRYLNNEAVVAVAPSLAYRFGKFALRYRIALATACAFALVLIVAAVLTVRQSLRADRETAVAEAVNNFLQNDLLAQASAVNQSSPLAKPDPDLKVRTALDRAATRISGKFEHEPDEEASIRETIGQTYIDLGLYPQAREQVQRALDLRRQAGPNDAKTIRDNTLIARIAFLQGKYPEAETLLTQILPVSRRFLGPEHPDTVFAMDTLANVYQWQAKYAQSEALFSRALEIRRRLRGADDPETLSSANGLATVYFSQGKYQQAEALYLKNLEVERRLLGPEHPGTLSAMNNLGLVYKSEGQYEKAVEILSQTVEIRRRVLGPQHRDTLFSMNNLGVTYLQQGRFADAGVLFSEEAEIFRRQEGSESPHTLNVVANAAIVDIELGDTATAISLLAQTVEIQTRVLGPEHPGTLNNENNLADAYTLDQQYSRAEQLYNKILEIRRRVLGPEHPETLMTVADLGTMYQREGKFALAEKFASQALAGRRHASGSDNPDTMISAGDLALAYLSQGEFVGAEPLAREDLAFQEKRQPGDLQHYRAETLLGECLSQQKKYAEAEPFLLEGYRWMLSRKDRIGQSNCVHLENARGWLVELYVAWGKPQKATEFKRKPGSVPT
jgi:tetratricopeptide (TPR) repeat protein